MTILDQLADYARVRTEQAKKRIPPEEIRGQALSLPKGTFAFENALKKPGISFICECKKASPSKGLIALDFPYLEIAKEYESAGADCISVLTEPKWFLGSDEYLKEIAKFVSIPCLRKDFTVDEYMIYEAKVLGASAVLLICSILTEKELQAYLSLCDQLGLSALVEAHDEREVQGCYEIGPVFPNVKKCTAAAAANCRNGKVWALPEKRDTMRLPPETKACACIVQEPPVFITKTGGLCVKSVLIHINSHAPTLSCMAAQ